MAAGLDPLGNELFFLDLVGSGAVVWNASAWTCGDSLPQRVRLAGAMLRAIRRQQAAAVHRGALQSWLRLEVLAAGRSGGWIWVRTRARRLPSSAYLESDSPGRTKGTGAWEPEQ